MMTHQGWTLAWDLHTRGCCVRLRQQRADHRLQEQITKGMTTESLRNEGNLEFMELCGEIVPTGHLMCKARPEGQGSAREGHGEARASGDRAEHCEAAHLEG